MPNEVCEVVPHFGKLMRFGGFWDAYLKRIELPRAPVT